MTMTSSSPVQKRSTLEAWVRTKRLEQKGPVGLGGSGPRVVAGQGAPEMEEELVLLQPLPLAYKLGN